MVHSIGKTIAELRKAKGWTQIELAEKLQVSDKAVSKWEQDNGVPSIEFFPTLAEVFGVSIDYLMTGKKVEPKIIAISKAELCAKNDDVSLVKDINLTTKDENGKTLIDYIIQYKSYKVFAAICDEKRFIDLQNSHTSNVKKFDKLSLIEFALITNKISVLERGFTLRTLNSYSGLAVYDLKSLTHVEEENNLRQEKQLCFLTDNIFDIIANDKRIKKNTIQYLLSKQNKSECVWYLGLPYILHHSYLHKNIELFNMVLSVAIENNQYAYENKKIVIDRCYSANKKIGFFNVSNKGTGAIPYGLVRVLEKTIKLALERSDIETVEKLNSLNTAVMEYYGQFKCYLATADEIRIAKLKMDKSISESEIKIQSTIHEGVVCIDELLELKDFKIIKKALNEYPIHIVELLDEWLSKSKWKELYHFAIDNNNENLANAIIAKDDKEYIKRAIQEYFKKDKYNFNKKHFYYYVNAKKVELFAQNYGTYYQKNIEIESAIEKLSNCKQRIIDDLSLRLDKEKTIGDLTKEYFEKELAKRNFDTIIIKLCIRLESILKNDYRYEGTFAEMLDKFCNAELYWVGDDGWGYPTEECDSKTIKVLNKLRMKRNNIVHSEKNDVDLTLEELQYCIDYICKMG